MKDKISIIAGGSGQFGVYLSQFLLKKGYKTIISTSNEKLAKKIAEEQVKQNVKPKIFIQINLGEESQKSGINKEQLKDFYNFSKNLKIEPQDIENNILILHLGHGSNYHF